MWKRIWQNTLRLVTAPRGQEVQAADRKSKIRELRQGGTSLELEEGW